MSTRLLSRQVRPATEPVPAVGPTPDETARWSGPALVAIWTTAVTTAVFGPLVWHGGIVLLLDSPANLVGPYPRIAMTSWGAAPELTARAPIEALLVLSFRLVPWGPLRLVPMLAMPAVAAWGFWRLTRRDPLWTIASTTIFAVNPFLHDRIEAGQVFFVAGVALLPLLGSLLWAPLTGKRVAGAAACIAAMAALSVHLLFCAAILLLGVAAVRIAQRRRRDAVGVIGAGLGATILMLYWILPSLPGATSAGRVGATDLAAFRTSGDPLLGLYPNLLAFYGFWRQGWVLTKDVLPMWPLLAVGVLVVAAFGLQRLHHGPRAADLVAPMLVAGFAGLLLAAGDRGLLGGAYARVYAEVPVFRVMREPQKWLALFVLAVSVTFGAGAATVVRAMTSRRGSAAALVALLALPLAAGAAELGGGWGTIRPVSLPASWAAADRQMGSGPGAVVVLPWTRYLRLPFDRGRVAADPAVSAFRRPVVMSDDAGYEGVAVGGVDARSSAVGRLLRSPTDTTGRELARLGVRYIVVVRVSGWRADLILARRAGLEPVHRWPDLALFQVTSTATPAATP